MSELKILVPLDGLSLAEGAIPYVEELGRLGSIELRLVAVADTLEAPATGKVSEWLHRDLKLLRAYLQEQQELLMHRHSTWQVHVEVHQGSPAREILAAIEDFKPSVVVLSSHGRSGLDRWRLGSVADKVVREAHCNTLVVGPHPAKHPLSARIESVLVPLDGSELAEQALPVAEEFVTRTGAKLHIVRAVALPMLVGDGLTYSYLPEQMEAMKEAADAYIADLIGREARYSPIASVIQGSVAEVLRNYVAANGIDLVVMTSHGRGGLLRTALGSVTDRLLGGVAPVLMVRELLGASSAATG